MLRAGVHGESVNAKIETAETKKGKNSTNVPGAYLSIAYIHMMERSWTCSLDPWYLYEGNEPAIQQLNNRHWTKGSNCWQSLLIYLLEDDNTDLIPSGAVTPAKHNWSKVFQGIVNYLSFTARYREFKICREVSIANGSKNGS